MVSDSDFIFIRNPICSARNICLSMSNLLLRYTVQNNQITLIRLIIPVIIALPVLNSPLSATTKPASTKWSTVLNHLVTFPFWQLLKKHIQEKWILEGKAVSSHVCWGVMKSLLVYWAQSCPKVWSESKGAHLRIVSPLTVGGWDTGRRYSLEPYWMLILKWF